MMGWGNFVGGVRRSAATPPTWILPDSPTQLKYWKMAKSEDRYNMMHCLRESVAVS
jgi:hypothetical protein